MTNNNPAYQASVRELQRLYYRKEPPNGHAPADFKPYDGIFNAAYAAYRDGNSIDAMCKAIDVAAMIDPAVKAMLAEKIPEEAVFSLRSLLAQELPPVRWAVPGILPEGVTILGGKPKMGKSWLSMGLGVALASGGIALGTIPVEQGDVLYLALEDNRRRLQKRVKKLLQEGPIPDGMDFAIQWPRLQEGGLTKIEAWLEQHPKARLIIIDTLEKIRPKRNDRGSIYGDDYGSVDGLGAIVEKYHVSILIIHHLRKADADDPFDMLSGSTGLTGAVDGVMILKRERGQADASIFIDGRDLDEPKDLALEWSQEHAMWSIIGTADEFRLSQERKAILTEIKNAQGNITLKELAQAVDQPYNNLKKNVSEMIQDGQIKQVSKGVYALPAYR